MTKRAMAAPGIVLGFWATAFAQQPTPPKETPPNPATTPPASQPAAAPATSPASPGAAEPGSTSPANPRAPAAGLPSLDEALGLVAPPAIRPAQPAVNPELARVLGGEEQGDELVRAVRLMEQSAARLADAADTSVQTQRVQEETIRLLDALIRKGKQKQQQKGQGQQSQSQDEQGQQPQQSQSSQQQQGAERAGGEPAEGERGGNTSAQMKPALDAARAAWGNLPARVRQALMQGSGDSFSKEYQKLTEEYYRRLGESGGGR